MYIDLQFAALATSLLAGIGLFLLIYGLFRHPEPLEPPINRRIALAMGAGARKTIFEQPLLTPFTGPAVRLARRMSLPGVRRLIRRDLEASGNPAGYSIEEYLALTLLCAVTLGFCSVLSTLLLLQQLDPLLAVISILVGFALPLYNLHDRAARRLLRISKQLPYTLDLIALTMAAGSSLSEAIETIIRDNPQDDLNQELKILQAEIEFGSKRSLALANLAQRIPVEALRSVVGAINQAEVLGTPLSSILMTQSGMLRMHRSVRAEKLSASASLRILIPSMLILLAVVLAVFGPMLLRWRQHSFM